ncbi:MAG: hypothetical protein WCY11_20440 [Novosphingobium sp.]
MIEITAPAVVDEDFFQLVLDHLKIDAGDPEDTYEDPGDAALLPLVEHYVEAAIGQVEACSGRALFKRTCKLTLDRFSTAVTLPESPVIEVKSVQYIGTDGATVTLDPADYVLIDRLNKPSLFPAYGKSWPAVRAFPGSVSITFDAGYGEGADDIPAPLRQAVLMTCADWFRFGGNVATVALHGIPDDAYRACQPFRREWQ